MLNIILCYPKCTYSIEFGGHFSSLRHDTVIHKDLEVNHAKAFVFNNSYKQNRIIINTFYHEIHLNIFHTNKLSRKQTTDLNQRLTNFYFSILWPED